MIERNWEDGELRILVKLYPFMPVNDLADYLKRSESSITHKATRLNLKKDSDALKVIKSHSRIGEKGSNWKGGKKVNKSGYVLVLDRINPMSDTTGYIMEHRLAMSRFLGRALKQNEVVHHLNGIKTDNRIENLQLMLQGEHTILHHQGEKRSDETRAKISIKARERFKDETKHPFYKNIDIKKCLEERASGKTVKQICRENGITTRTYYNKLKKEISI